MSLFKKAEKTIPKGKYRVIKISKEALFEFIYESFIDNQECFFDVSDVTSIASSFDIDWDKGEFICIARSCSDDNEHLQSDNIDTSRLLAVLEDTTSSLYNNDNRFIELTYAKIKELQGK